MSVRMLGSEGLVPDGHFAFPGPVGKTHDGHSVLVPRDRLSAHSVEFVFGDELAFEVGAHVVPTVL